MCRSVFGGTGVAQRSLPSDRPGIGLDRTAACASIVVTNREARTFSGLGIGTGSAGIGLDPGCNLQGSVYWIGFDRACDLQGSVLDRLGSDL